MSNLTKTSKALYLPALRSKMGSWTCYLANLRLGDIVNYLFMARTRSIILKILMKWIQREIQPKRTAKIAEYLLTNNDRFFSSLVVTVYGGKPQWLLLANGQHSIVG